MPPIRPRKVKLLAPAFPGNVNEPVTFFQRVHLAFLRFLRVWVLHLPLSLRPVVLRSTLNATEAASVRLKETLVPTGALGFLAFFFLPFSSGR